MSTHFRTRAKESKVVASGLVLFAAVMLLIAGFLEFFRGVMAIAKDEVFVTTPNYVFKFDLTSWGWIHLILGIFAILVSITLFKGALWVRVLGVTVAALLILVNFLSIPYYPLWSIVSIAFYAFVIWALCSVRRDDSTASRA